VAEKDNLPAAVPRALRQRRTTTCEGEGLHATKVVALHAGQGYIVLFASPIGLGLEADRSTLNSILTTFRFVPA
jgi:hypothetical protein